MSGPAACQNRSSITPAGISSRHPVTTFPVGTCQPRANGTSASSPARRASDSQHDPSGIRVIAIISRMTSGYDMIRRRCRFLSRPVHERRVHDRLDHPVPEMHAPARPAGPGPAATHPPGPSRPAGSPPEPSPPGRQNTVSSPADGTAPPAVTVPATANQQVSGPHYDRSVREPRYSGTPMSGLHQQRQADKKAQGAPGRARTRHPNAYQEPRPRANHLTPARENHRSLPSHSGPISLKSVVLGSRSGL